MTRISSMFATEALVVVAFLLGSCLFGTSNAYTLCPTTGDLCPDGNTCCEGSCVIVHNTTASTCITGRVNETEGDCCSDDAREDDGGGGPTGCGSGYECASSSNGRSGGDSSRGGLPSQRFFCVKKNNNPDLPDVLPRYKLCHLPPEAYARVHGLPVGGGDSSAFTSASETQAQLAYLSTAGALDSPDPVDLQRHLRVKIAVVMVHGSGRNADDYLCATSAAVRSPYSSENDDDAVMVIAPWFLADTDGPVTLFGRDPDVPALRWFEQSGPIEHAWRYGADACNANNSNNTSSYAAVDSVLDRLFYDRVRFPTLERIVVAGHSAGGQFTQRWALLSNHPAFASGRVSVRTVAANPKSFCYLDARRFVATAHNVTGHDDEGDKEEFRVPDETTIAKCPFYNEWEWGLDDGSFLPTPYKDMSIAEAGGKDAVVTRYATRDIVYLSGELDVIPNGYYCMERIQGKNRRVRSERFYESLKIIYGGRQVHRRLVVRGVHHDHALMFQSLEGREAMFGGGVGGYGGGLMSHLTLRNPRDAFAY